MNARVGIGMHSYGAHWAAARKGNPPTPFRDPLTFLQYAHRLGAAGVQVAIGACGAEQAAQLRDATDALGMYIEGQVRLPQGALDAARFETEVADAKSAGATVIRSAFLAGRRYETFDSWEDFREFRNRSWESLTLAEPILRQHRVRLAVENHKDWLIPDLLEMLQRLSSEFVGVCLDFGNSIAMLEHPMEVIDAYAPFVASTHVKDMAVAESDDGFLLSEVPFGTGFLQLNDMLGACRRRNPNVQFNVEMITRDPLGIPCLTENYWATLRHLPAKRLGRALGMVQVHADPDALVRVDGLSPEQRLAKEDQNVRACLAYARTRLNRIPR